MLNDRQNTTNVTYLDAPIERAWRATVHPDGLNRWLSDVVLFSGDPGSPRPGDRYQFGYGDITNETTIAEVAPPLRLVLADHYVTRMPDGTPRPYALRTTYSLQPTADGVRYEVHVFGYPDDDLGQWIRDCMYMGWRKSLLNLKAVLETGQDLRKAIYGYPRLGLAQQTLLPSQRERTGAQAGNYVIAAWDGPAARAGIGPDDVVVAIAGQPTPTYDDYVRALANLHDDQPVAVEFVRRGVRHRVEVRLTTEPRFTGLISPEESEALLMERLRR